MQEFATYLRRHLRYLRCEEKKKKKKSSKFALIVIKNLKK